MRGGSYLLVVILVISVLLLSACQDGAYGPTGRATPPTPIDDPNQDSPVDDPDIPQQDTPVEVDELSPLIYRFIPGVYPAPKRTEPSNLVGVKKANIFIQGDLMVVDSTGYEFYKDYCEGKTLIQYIYDEETRLVKEERTECLTDCRDGACLQTNCIDSDGGDVPNKVGFVEGLGVDGLYYKEDYCFTPTTLREYQCINYVVQSYDLPCEFGCKQGRCLEEKEINEIEPTSYCEDSDGSYDYFTKGTIQGTDLNHEDYSFTDSCDGNIVADYYCTGDLSNGYGLTFVGCSLGCENGACIKGDDDMTYNVCIDSMCVEVQGKGVDLCQEDNECSGRGTGRYKALLLQASTEEVITLQSGSEVCALTAQPGLEPCSDKIEVVKTEFSCNDLDGVPCPSGRCLGKYVGVTDRNNCCVGNCLPAGIALLNRFLIGFN